jgi:hypothetical protein
VDRLDPLGLAYVHVVEGDTGGARDVPPFDYDALRDRYHGIWIVNNGYDRAMAMAVVASGRADLVAFGRAFLANPDLVMRLEADAPLNPMMAADTIYGGGAHGYTDYPFLPSPFTADRIPAGGWTSPPAGSAWRLPKPWIRTPSRRQTWCAHLYSATRLSRSALSTTEQDDSAIAPAANAGESSRPVTG